MHPDLLTECATLLSPLLKTEEQRRALLDCCIPATLTAQIDFDGPASDFAPRLITRLSEHGEIEPGKPALVALLETARARVGLDQQAQIDALIGELQHTRDTARQVIMMTPQQPQDDRAAELRGRHSADIEHVLREIQELHDEVRVLNAKYDDDIRERRQHDTRLEALERAYLGLSERTDTIWKTLFGNGGSGRIGMFVQFRWVRTVVAAGVVMFAVTLPLLVGILLTILSRLPGG
jgi:hypothetical protein